MTSSASFPLRTLGNSDLQLSRIGFGAWAIGGGDWTYAWGPQDDNESVAAIHRAIELGINWIDTAAIYGLGHSEEVVARAVKSASRRPYVFTKCGIRWGADRVPYRSLKAASVTEELEASLRRLQVDTIDLYQIHWADPDPEIEEAWETLARHREQGKIRWIGVSNFTVEQMKRVREISPITSLQPPYSMLRPAIEAEILPYVRDCGIGVINYSPMVNGLLSGNLRLVELLREIGAGHGVTPGVVAVAWTLHNPAITAAIVGGRSAKQVEELSGALHYKISDDEHARINAFITSNPV